MTNHSNEHFDLLALFDISNRLTGTVDPLGALRAMLYTAQAHAGADKAGLYVMNTLHTALDPLTLHGVNAVAVPLPFPDPWIQALMLRDEATDLASSPPPTGAASLLVHQGFRTAWPIRRDQHLLGLLALGPCRTQEAYSSNARHLVGILAAFAGTLIERERLLAELRQSEKLSALGQLVAGIAHELKNPLSAIVGYAQLLEKSLKGDRAVKDVTAIHQQAERALDTVQHLLTFARQRPLQFQSVDLRDVIQEAVRLHAPTMPPSDIAVFVTHADALPRVSADPAALQHALLNLLHNAADAIRTRPAPSPEGGRITLSTASTSKDIRIGIRDNGVGIPATIQSKIFDPFFTTKPVGSGTGLGLSIVHSLIAQHGGHLTCESREGDGTTFLICLPLGPEAV